MNAMHPELNSNDGQLSQLSSYVSQMNKLNEAIQMIQRKYESLLLRQASLHNDLVKVFQQTGAGAVKAPPLPAKPILDESAFLADALRIADQSLTAHEFTVLICTRYPDFIPTQIIGNNAYIQRKLKKACQDNYLKEVMLPNAQGRCYILPEWDASNSGSLMHPAND